MTLLKKTRREMAASDTRVALPSVLHCVLDELMFMTDTDQSLLQTVKPNDSCSALSSKCPPRSRECAFHLQKRGVSPDEQCVFTL